MKKVVSLNQFRKSKARADAVTRADQNVVVHGRTKVAKNLDKARTDKDKHDHDQLKFDE